MKIAIDSYCFHRYFGEVYPNLEQSPSQNINLLDCVQTCIDFGIEGISIESFMFDQPSPQDIQQLKQLLDQYQLELVWAWGHPSGLYSGQKPEMLQDMYKHIEIAHLLDAKVMRICAGGRTTRPKTDWQNHKNALVPLLKEAVAYAEQYHLVLALENHVDFYADEIVDLIQTIDSPYLGICLDTANNLRMLEDPWQAIEKMLPFARATHIKDITAYEGDPKTFAFWPSVPAGKGLIPLEKTLKWLAEHHYQGLLALEIDYLHPDYMQKGAEHQAIQDSIHYLKQLRTSLQQQQGAA
ncbi:MULTISPECIES: sugar phosphate isomerase/epimerase family protein [unclassified Acinetobacter]|uniref:sugar phosphate isomerase/epimerase family protein n=1 Tax=unclassified Acinetobacter TaxID=196816 RepID=UPI00190C1A17|nr:MULTISPECIES: sugar phosphate isomerase/epimerase [unclassified Acinetobacter]MBK0063083.1 sugar phosphate isomerase/epimerase [Acinetobacter sp. S55]MBK0066499.1 sugar phosphate isomerase/epimerase [Acinetobacter sp. S54]